MSHPNLTIKQEKFALAYMETSNAYEAYCRTYNVANQKRATIDRNAYQLVAKNTKMVARLATLKQELATRNSISIDWVLQGLKDNFMRSMQAVPVLDKQGNSTGEYTYQGAIANQSLKLIGEHLGMFAARDMLKEAPVQITRVTVVLPPGHEPPVIEGEGYTVDGDSISN